MNDIKCTSSTDSTKGTWEFFSNENGIEVFEFGGSYKLVLLNLTETELKVSQATTISGVSYNLVLTYKPL